MWILTPKEYKTKHNKTLLEDMNLWDFDSRLKFVHTG